MSVQDVLFVNGPVNNGDFTFDHLPGKATGIRIAAALNQLVGNPAVPHLFNTAALAGDLRHRRHRLDDERTEPREDFEHRLITAKYDPSGPPAAGVATDTDPDTTALALRMTETALRTGTLAITTERVLRCVRCGHLTGLAAAGPRPCRACGHTTAAEHRQRLLVADRTPGLPALEAADIHAHRRRPPAHLQHIAGNVPDRLVLARTRDHGIALDPLGVPGLVLDPRAALHITALATAHRADAGTVVMLLTDNAAANIAAYGRPFLHHDGTRLLYGLHGRIPYDQLGQLDAAYERLRYNPARRERFERWFLPLYSWHAKTGITAARLPELLKHFHRSLGADGEHARELRDAIRAGDTRWLTDRPALATALRAVGPGGGPGTAGTRQES